MDNTDLKNKIQEELIEKTYYNDIKWNLRSRSIWKGVGDATEALSQILTGAATILAFAAGFFNYAMLSFIAGCLGTGALVFLKFSSYSMKESKERTEEVNQILIKLGMAPVVNVAIDSAVIEK